MGYEIDSTEPTLAEVLELIRTGQATRRQRFDFWRMQEQACAALRALERRL